MTSNNKNFIDPNMSPAKHQRPNVDGNNVPVSIPVPILEPVPVPIPMPYPYVGFTP